MFDWMNIKDRHHVNSQRRRPVQAECGKCGRMLPKENTHMVCALLEEERV